MNVLFNNFKTKYYVTVTFGWHDSKKIAKNNFMFINTN